VKQFKGRRQLKSVGQAKGQSGVLEFWQTACAPCLEAIPHLNELVEQFSNRVVFIRFRTITEIISKNF